MPHEFEPQRQVADSLKPSMPSLAVTMIAAFMASACNNVGDNGKDPGVNIMTTSVRGNSEEPPKNFWEKAETITDPDALQKLLEEPQANGKTLKDDALKMMGENRLVVNNQSPLQIGRIIKKEGQPVWISPQNSRFKDDITRDMSSHIMVMTYRDMKLFNSAKMGWGFGADTKNTKAPVRLSDMNKDQFTFEKPEELDQANIAIYVTENDGKNVVFISVGGKVKPLKSEGKGEKVEKTSRNINMIFQRDGAGNDAVVEMRLPAAP